MKKKQKNSKNNKKIKHLSLKTSDKSFGPGFAARRAGKAGSIIR